jgi:hypothetical protein
MLILTNTQFLIYSLINNIDYIIEIIIISLGVILLSSSIGKAVYEHGHRLLTGTAAGIAIYNTAKSMVDSGIDPEDEYKDKKMKLKLMKIKTLINKFKLIILPIITHYEYKHSFTFSILLSYLNINIGNEASFIAHYSFGMFILSLLVLYSFTNVICYLSSIALLKYYKIDDKYIKLKKIISYFEKMSTL